VRARQVRKAYADVVALDGVDLDVSAGQVHGLVGPNGAGKTTLLSLLLGLSLPDRGVLELLGSTVRRAHALPDGVAGFVEGPGLYPALTARQNLTAVASLRRIHGADVAGVLEQIGLTDVIDDRVRGFSLGMRQRLSLAAALLTRPELLVLDEPTNGLDPSATQCVLELLRRLADDGVAVVVSSHRMDELAALCHEVTLLSGGRAVFSGPLAKLAAESGPVDFRLRTTDVAGAGAVAAGVPRVTVRSAGDALVVRADQEALDTLVGRLVAAGLPVRELTAVVPPLQAAFLALTQDAP